METSENKGVLYVMTSVVKGVVKIGKTTDFEHRMAYLEDNGYANVVGLKRRYAIEVSNFDEKEGMLQHIFSKSRVAKTELFALDEELVIELLSSFDGKQIYPTSESKEEILVEASEIIESRKIPDGIYTLEHKKTSDGYKKVSARVKVEDGSWTLLKNSVLGVHEDKGVSTKARKTRLDLPLGSEGKLLEDFDLGKCTPSHAGAVVMNASCDGWLEWKDKNGNSIEVYKHSSITEDDE